MREGGLLLGIDIGTTRTKLLLVDEQGAELARASVPTPFRTEAGSTEMTAAALRSVLAEVLARLGSEIEGVEAVGVAGLAESGAPFDRRGDPLAPIIAWHDPRGEESVALLEQRFGPELASLVGQHLRTVSSVAKLGWLVGEGLGHVHRWVGVPELCLLALTGEWATDFSLAARTGCYDVGRRRWLPEVARALAIDPAVMPPVLAAGTPMGRVSGDGAAWSRLARGTPVTLAGHDHLAAVAGCGAGAEDLANSVGTAETVVGRAAHLPDVQRALAQRAAVTLVPTGDGWAVLASAARAGRVLHVAASALGRPFAELDALAVEATPLEAADLVADLQAGDASRLPSEDPGGVWAGLLQALAVRTAGAVARVGDVVGPAPRMVVFGGGSRSRRWLLAKSEVCPLSVWRSTTDEAAARGAAVYAGVAAGWWPSPTQAPRVELEEIA